MNRKELVEKVAGKTGVAKSQVDAVLGALIETVGTALKAGDSVTLVGFGTFSTSKRAARTGRNPKTGEAIKIPARRVPRFSAGAGLKQTVDAKKAAKK